MNLKIIQISATEPITLEEAKLHLRVTNTEEDNLIKSLITVARQRCESVTNRALVSTTFELIMDSFPEKIVLPMPPTESITWIKYTDYEGTEEEMPEEDYIFYNSEPAVIVPAYGKDWPSFNPYPKGAVKVRYVAGYKSSEDPGFILPEVIKEAMLLIIGIFYENREDILAKGHIPKSLPLGVDALLYPYRIWSF
jgi:uncharacterized phiE125 gp8 family phage protein